MKMAPSQMMAFWTDLCIILHRQPKGIFRRLEEARAYKKE
jgi:hypothetical protein